MVRPKNGAYVLGLDGVEYEDCVTVSVPAVDGYGNYITLEIFKSELEKILSGFATGTPE